MRTLLLALVAALLTTSPVQPEPSTPCLPPGVPALSTLVRIGGGPAFGRAQKPDGQFDPIRIFRSYWARHSEDMDPVLFINAANGYIATVDDAPLDQAVPFWYDTGMVNAAGHYIVDGRPSCHWERAGQSGVPSSESPTRPEAPGGHLDRL